MRHSSLSLRRGGRCYETDSERKQDFAEAERTFEVLSGVYRECGYELSELPKLPPSARAQFVVERLGF